jgi:hypothetical protein
MLAARPLLLVRGREDGIQDSNDRLDGCLQLSRSTENPVAGLVDGGYVGMRRQQLK